MKVITIILTAIVLFLTFKPGIDFVVSDSLAEKTCCMIKSGSTLDTNCTSTENEQEDCSGNFCNPFHTCSCGTCFLLCVAVSNRVLQQLEISTQQQFSYQFIFSSSFTTDFWKPPKFV